MSSTQTPQLGTCGGDHPCRWHEGDQCNAHPPQVFGDGDGRVERCQPWMADDDSCGEWQPPEGRVCGNCGHMLGYMGVESKACRVRSTSTGYRESTHPMNTCPAWRWLVPEVA